MKVQCTGKVVARTMRNGKDGQPSYTLVVEEPGEYPNTFAFRTKDSVILGDANGFAAKGRMVTVTGYAKGVVEDIPKKDGTGTWKKYSTWFRLASVTPYGEVSQPVAAAQPMQPAPDDMEDDIPF